MNFSEINDKELKELLRGLSFAIKKIGKEYFKLNLASEDNKDHYKYRERVYCYEFYHQLRNTLGCDYPYVINGEIDKKDHPIIASNKNPDFVIHNPGNMKQNFVIMEVKNLEGFSKSKRKNDIEKFITFFEECNYQYAIYLIYGEKENENTFKKNRENLEEQIKKKLSGSDKNLKYKKVIVLWHNDIRGEIDYDIISLPKKQRRL
jgi:hypothetical protein